MTLKDAAAQLGITAASLRQALARGSLRGRKVGNTWTVTPREVERYRADSLGRRGRKAHVSRSQERDAADLLDRVVGEG